MEIVPIPNVLDPNCGSRRLLELIGDKWTMLVLYVLFPETKRYNQIQREIGDISQKVLTHTLRRMETNGLVKRTSYPVVPPRVEYAVTPLGMSLREPLSAMCAWSQAHIADVEQARIQAEKRNLTAT